MATPTPTPLPLGQGQLPPFFNEYAGSVTIGGSPAPNGMEIQARVRWWRSDMVRTYNGRYQGLIVSPNDWALQGQTITFHIGDRQANETATYNGRSLVFDFLNLTFP